MAKPPVVLPISYQLEQNEIEQLDILKEIDKLHRYIAELYVDRQYTGVKTHIPHLTRRWEHLVKLLVRREEIILHAQPKEITKPTPFDYTRQEYDYD